MAEDLKRREILKFTAGTIIAASAWPVSSPGMYPPMAAPSARWTRPLRAWPKALPPRRVRWR